MPVIKTAELVGAQLDWAVAKAEGKHSVPHQWGNAGINDLGRCSIAHNNWNGAKYFEPSKNWGHGGPIIEREKVAIREWQVREGWKAVIEHDSALHVSTWEAFGPTPLVAAMRCYVETKLGDSVDVPDCPENPPKRIK